MKTKPFSIKLSNEAEIDFNESYEYYFKDSPKVADTFFRAINSCFEHIKQNPDSFPYVFRDVRKYVVKKFPFVIYYRIADSIIQVIGIFHTSRNPQIWNERI